MAYVAQYSVSDMDDIFVDTVAITGAEINANLVIIVGLIIVLIIIGLAVQLFGKGTSFLNKIQNLGK